MNGSNLSLVAISVQPSVLACTTSGDRWCRVGVYPGWSVGVPGSIYQDQYMRVQGQYMREYRPIQWRARINKYSSGVSSAKDATSWKKTKKTNSTLFSTFVQNGANLTPNRPYIKGKVSTTRSDEDPLDPKPTLSFSIAQFHLSEPESYKLAMNYRLVGL